MGKCTSYFTTFLHFSSSFNILSCFVSFMPLVMTDTRLCSFIDNKYICTYVFSAATEKLFYSTPDTFCVINISTNKKYSIFGFQVFKITRVSRMVFGK